MTTSRSPLRKLKEQADKIAREIKATERGEQTASDVGGKIAAARTRATITFGVVMDDKVIKIEMPWATIKSMSEAGISEYILKYMRDARDTVH